MELPGGYKLKCINDDFQVIEVPLVPSLVLKRPYKFTYVWIQKSGFTTFEVIEQLKRRQDAQGKKKEIDEDSHPQEKKTQKENAP